MNKPAPGKVAIVLVEDNVELCNGWRELFRLLGHQVSCYQRAMDALADFSALEGADLVITDYYLPDMNGVDFIRKARRQLPGLEVVVVTGSRESFIAEAVRELSNARMIYKPLNIEDIEREIARLPRAQA